jgi:hypothetical protein
MINIDIDLSELLDLQQTLEPKIMEELRKGAELLSMQAHAHLLELAQTQLHTTRERYISAVSFKQVDEDTWSIDLDASAMWIENGMQQHEMIQAMLKSPKAKTSKSGDKYLVVPFDHKKGPTKQSQAGTDLTSTIKQELAKRKIPYAKIEKNNQGNPRLGLLHSFDILNKPMKTHEGPGQGRGPIGMVRQGTTGIPHLKGVRIYQNEFKDEKTGKKSVKRSIMTFRVVSSKQIGSGKWIHPGIPPKLLFDKTAEWAIDEFKNKIGPMILDKLAREV